MLGLVSYDSDEEEEVAQPPKQASPQQSKPAAPADPDTIVTKPEPAVNPAPESVAPVEKPQPQPSLVVGGTQPQLEDESAKLPSAAAGEGPALGPALGPSMPEAPETTVEEEGAGPPLSPYSAARAEIRTLTLPRVANYDIPPSPPGSPPPDSTKKFANFLALKKKGVHFNARLESSSALRNPALFKKLSEYAHLEEKDQYATTLPPELDTPIDFPSWAYPEEVAKRHQQRKKARGQVDFVPAKASSSASTPSKGGIADRVRAGLSRESTNSPGIAESSRRGEDDRPNKKLRR